MACAEWQRRVLPTLILKMVTFVESIHECDIENPHPQKIIAPWVGSRDAGGADYYVYEVIYGGLALMIPSKEFMNFGSEDRDLKLQSL